MYVYIYMYMYIHIYIYRERDIKFAILLHHVVHTTMC